MPAEQHLHPTSNVVQQTKDIIVKSIHNKSLKRQACGSSSFYNHRNRPHRVHINDPKRRRVGGECDRAERCTSINRVVTRNRKGVSSSHCPPYHRRYTSLSRILGIPQRPPQQHQQQQEQQDKYSSTDSEIQQQIHALQHILCLAEQPSTPETIEWTVSVLSENAGVCEVLANAYISMKYDILGLPVSKYVPFCHLLTFSSFFEFYYFFLSNFSLLLF